VLCREGLISGRTLGEVRHCIDLEVGGIVISKAQQRRGGGGRKKRSQQKKTPGTRQSQYKAKG